MERLLAGCQLFAGLDKLVLRSLAVHARLQGESRGDFLWHEGQAADAFRVIRSGLVKIVALVPDGSENILGLFGPRESIGEVAVCGHGAYPANAVVASERAELIVLPCAPVLELARTRVELADALNRSLASHCQALRSKIQVMGAGAVPKRLATLLLWLAERYGDQLEDGDLIIPIAISRGELASLVSARIETTIRAVRQWERAGVLETLPDGFRIKRAEELHELTRAENRGRGPARAAS